MNFNKWCSWIKDCFLLLINVFIVMFDFRFFFINVMDSFTDKWEWADQAISCWTEDWRTGIHQRGKAWLSLDLLLDHTHRAWTSPGTRTDSRVSYKSFPSASSTFKRRWVKVLKRLLLCLVVAAVTGCRGYPSSRLPVAIGWRGASPHWEDIHADRRPGLLWVRNCKVWRDIGRGTETCGQSQPSLLH